MLMTVLFELDGLGLTIVTCFRIVCRRLRKDFSRFRKVRCLLQGSHPSVQGLRSSLQGSMLFPQGSPKLKNKKRNPEGFLFFI